MAQGHRSARSPIASDRCRATSSSSLDGYALRVRRRDSARIVERAARAARHAQRAAPVRRRGSCSTILVARYRRALRPRVPRPTAPGSIPTTSTSLFDRQRPASPIRRSPARSRAGEAPPEGWEHELPPALRRRPRCARRSSACGRCCPAPSSSTTSSGSRARPLGGRRRAHRGRAGGCCTAPRERRRRRRRVDRSRRRARRRSRRAARAGRARPGPRARRRARRRRGARAARDAWSRSSASAGYADAADARARATASDAPTAPTTPTASRAPSVTCSSTRRRTSPRCSGACSPAAARRDR